MKSINKALRLLALPAIMSCSALLSYYLLYTSHIHQEVPYGVCTSTNTAIVVVDVQKDFTEQCDGSLAVGDTKADYLQEVAQALQWFKTRGFTIFATQDWHPRDHVSFASAHQGGKPHGSITLADGRKQVLWPIHCVINSTGAELSDEIISFIAPDHIIRKGSDQAYDSYSGFKDDGGQATRLQALLRKLGVEHIIILGIATDYCVYYTAKDGRELGFEVILLKDLSRGVASDTTQVALQDMQAKGVRITSWRQLQQVLVH